VREARKRNITGIDMGGSFSQDAGGGKSSPLEIDYRAVAAAAEEGFFRLEDADGRFIECNEACARILGYVPEELKGRPLSEVLASRSRSAFEREVMTRVKERGYSGHVELECVRKDGTEAAVEIQVYALREGGAWGVLRDVSRSKAVMNRLRESEEKFAAFVNTSCYGYAETDRKGRIRFANDRLLDMFHYRREDIVGRPFSRFIDPEDKGAALRDFDLVFSAPNAGPRRHVLIDGRGERRVCEINSIPLKWNGRIVGTQTTVLDVTDRVRAREREKRHMEVLEFLSRSAMDFWRMESLTELCRYIADKIVELLEERAAVFVFSRGASPGVLKPEAGAGLGARRRKTARAWRGVTAGAGVKPGEGIASFLGGGLVRCRGLSDLFGEAASRPPLDALEESLAGRCMYAAALGLEDVPVGLVVIVAEGDISSHASAVETFLRQASVACGKWKAIEEKQKLYEQFLQSQKMEAIGSLSGGIAHDINNVLTAITGYCDIILPRLSRHPFLREQVEGIKKCVDRAGSITRQLLAFGRRQIMKPRVSNINRIIEEVAMMLRHLIGEDVRLVLDLDRSVGAVNVDRVQVEQVILNLAVNARDAMPEGGVITISTREATLEEARCRVNPEARPGRYAVIEFSDTGTGIKEELLPHIFEPFFSTKEAGKGTGLGLSTVYGIVQQHKGIIEVSSTYGEGTTFSLYFPVATEEEKRSQQYLKKRSRLRGKKGETAVLIVEDDETVCEVTAKLLAESGFRVDTAGNAEEAVALFRRKRGRFDLVISDMVLPGKNGLQLVEELFRLKPGIPVILCSGYSDDRSLREKIMERRISFIHKPYDLEEMLELIHQVL